MTELLPATVQVALPGRTAIKNQPTRGAQSWWAGLHEHHCNFHACTEQLRTTFDQA